MVVHFVCPPAAACDEAKQPMRIALTAIAAVAVATATVAGGTVTTRHTLLALADACEERIQLLCLGEAARELGERRLYHIWCVGSAVHRGEGARCGRAPCVTLSGAWVTSSISMPTPRLGR